MPIRTNVPCPDCDRPLYYKEELMIAFDEDPNANLIANLLDGGRTITILYHPNPWPCAFEAVGEHRRVPIHGDPHRDTKPVAVFQALTPSAPTT